MAERKSLQLTPVLDNSALDADPELETSKVVHAMRPVELNSVIRRVLNAKPETVAVVKNAVEARLKELELDSDLGLAIKKAPKTGSDQFDAGTFIAWVNKVQIEDDDSVRQLLVIDATIQSKG